MTLELKNLYEENRKENDNSLSFLDSHADCLIRGTSMTRRQKLEKKWH